jgi:hypothetical protein
MHMHMPRPPCCALALLALALALALLASGVARLVISFFERAAYKYKQQAVENQSIICQMKTQPASWTTAAANFFFTLRARD